MTRSSSVNRSRPRPRYSQSRSRHRRGKRASRSHSRSVRPDLRRDRSSRSPAGRASRPRDLQALSPHRLRSPSEIRWDRDRNNKRDRATSRSRPRGADRRRPRYSRSPRRSPSLSGSRRYRDHSRQRSRAPSDKRRSSRRDPPRYRSSPRPPRRNPSSSRSRSRGRIQRSRRSSSPLPPRSNGVPSTSARSRFPTDSKLPELGQILRGQVNSIQSYGAFVQIDGFQRNGLVHISALAQGRTEDVKDVVRLGQEVWAKVISAENGRFNLSMKAVDQETGEELNSEQRGYGRGGSKHIDLDQAMAKKTCTKCGGSGHFPYECRNQGQKYDYVPDVTEKKPRFSAASASTQLAGRGRGKGATLPAWMTAQGQPEPPQSSSPLLPSPPDHRDRPRSPERGKTNDDALSDFTSGGRGRGLALTKPAWLVEHERSEQHQNGSVVKRGRDKRRRSLSREDDRRLGDDGEDYSREKRKEHKREHKRKHKKRSPSTSRSRSKSRKTSGKRSR